MSFTTRTLQAVKWSYAGAGVRAVAQLVAQVGLARLLGPDIIGSFGYALLLMGVLGLVVEQGLGAAVVHAAATDPRDVRTVFWRALTVGAAFWVITYVAANPIAALIGGADADVDAVIRAFSPAYLLLALGIVAQAELRRTLRFRELQFATTFSYLIAYLGIGLGAAAAGFGVWSLIAAWFSQAIISAVIMYLYVRHSLLPINPFRKLSIAKYGRDITAINLVNWLVDNAVGVYVGKMLGATGLGIFNFSMAFVRTPLNHVVVNLQNVLFPVASVARTNDAGMQKLFVTTMTAVSLLTFPAYTFLAIESDAIVHLLLGPAWREAAACLALLALTMVPHALTSIAGTLLSARGDQRVELKAQLGAFACLSVAFVLLSEPTLVSACSLLLGVYLARAAILLRVVSRKLRIPAQDLFRALRGPAIVAVAVALCAYTSGSLLGAGGEEMPMIAIAVGAVSAFFCALTMTALMPRLILSEPLLAIVAADKSVAGLTLLTRVLRPKAAHK